MSLFKVKPWWSNEKLQTEAPSEGVLNGSCLRVERLSTHSDSDCIMLAEEALLKIYKPSGDTNTSQLLLESHLNAVVLHLDVGKFTIGAEHRQIIVLHPQSYAVYDLQKKEGHTDAGEQNSLAFILKHSFTRKAFSLTCGPFGDIKSRDLICIQGLDGSLSFFDQDTFVFICVFDNIIVAGPVAYVASSDTFVICNSSWVLEIYSYQQLRQSSELSPKQSKKENPQWVYNAGEEISSVQVIKTSNNFSSIVALGERYLYCFQDNGLMKFIKKFDYMPICFYAYLIGWYYEPTARLLVMVSSDDCKLYIYEGTTLLWSCQLLNMPISLSRCFLKNLSGGIVTLSANGTVSVSYVGTEPDLNPGATSMVNDTSDPESVQTELEHVEKTLQKIMHNRDDVDVGYKSIEELVKIKADCGRPVQNLFQQMTFDVEEGLHLLMCPVVVILSCEEPKHVQAVQITYVCSPPFACSDPSICLDSVNGTEIIENHVFLSSDADMSDVYIKLLFTITDTAGKIVVLSRSVLLPISLYGVPAEAVPISLYGVPAEAVPISLYGVPAEAVPISLYGVPAEAVPISLYGVPAEAVSDNVVFEIQTNKMCIDLQDLFSDFTKDDLERKHSTRDIVSFIYRTNNKPATIRANGEKYIIECMDLSQLIPILECVTYKLMEHFTRMEVKDFQINIRVEESFKTHLSHKFLKSIDAHAKDRINIKKLQDDMNVLQRQFVLVQKRLLVQYGSAPPGDCDPLELLMRDTYRRLTDTVHDIIQCQRNVCRAGCTMAALGQLIAYTLRMTSTNNANVKLFEEMISLNSLYEDNQEWEESVTQGLSYVLNNVFNKSTKDKEKLAPVSEQGVLSHVNLKRFLKQLRMLLETMFEETDEGQKEENVKTDKPKKVTRFEEIVEII